MYLPRVTAHQFGSRHAALIRRSSGNNQDRTAGCGHGLDDCRVESGSGGGEPDDSVSDGVAGREGGEMVAGVETEAPVNKVRVAVIALTLSLGGLGAWIASEGSSPAVVVDGEERLAPHIPTKGDVPTIGHGSTRYEDGRPVTLDDPP